MGDPGVSSVDLLNVVRGLLENQQKQAEAQKKQTEALLKELVEVQSAAVVALEKAVAPALLKLGTLTDFIRAGPRNFKGTENGLAAKEWLLHTKNLLEASHVSEEDKVSFVKLQLTDLAREWWVAEESRLKDVVTWTVFREGFLNQFFPSTEKVDLRRKFMYLRQGSRTVNEYAAAFSSLIPYAQGIVSNEEEKALHFRDGLNFDIQASMTGFNATTYEEVLSAAKRHEQLVIRRKKATKNQKRFRAEAS